MPLSTTAASHQGQEYRWLPSSHQDQWTNKTLSTTATSHQGQEYQWLPSLQQFKSGDSSNLQSQQSEALDHFRRIMPTKTKTKIQKGGRNVWNSSRPRQDTNLEGVGEDYQEKASATTLGTSHHLPHNISEGINYGDNGCLNNFSIICDNYGDVWKVHQTNVAPSPRIGGGGGKPGNNPV